MTIPKNSCLELIAINGSVYRFNFSFNEQIIACGYECIKIKSGKSYRLDTAVYLALGLCEELEERVVKQCMEKRDDKNPLYEEELELSLNIDRPKYIERNNPNTDEITEIIKEYYSASRAFLIIALKKGLSFLSDSRVVYFDGSSKRLMHSGLIKSVRTKTDS